MVVSRYDEIDTTKWQHIQIRVSPRMKERLKLSCRLNEIDVSGLTRLFYNAWLASEQYDPQEAPMVARFDWSFQRIKTFFKGDKNGNGGRHYSRHL